MPRVNQVDSGSYRTEGDEQAYYIAWDIEDDDHSAELQVSQRREEDLITTVELAWESPIHQADWLDVMDGTAPVTGGNVLLGCNPEVLIYSEAAPEESPFRTTYVEHRHRGERLSAPDAFELRHGGPPEEYRVSWSRYQREYAPNHRVGVTFNPRVIDYHPEDISLRDHLETQILVTAPDQDAAEISRVAADITDYTQDTDIWEYASL